MDRQFLREAIFNAMTSNAFKLGTVLSLGWFWMRRSGSIVLYQGVDLSKIDFENILSVFEMDAEEVWPPAYTEHTANHSYYYLVRRVNFCGFCQLGLQAVSRVSIDSDGHLSKPRPNSVIGLKSNFTSDKKIVLIWAYNPIGQEIEPAEFKIYTDNGSGGIDYDNALASVKYEGRGYYRYIIEGLTEGRRIFAVRASSAEGMEGSTSIVCLDFGQQAVEPASIYSAEEF